MVCTYRDEDDEDEWGLCNCSHEMGCDEITSMHRVIYHSPLVASDTAVVFMDKRPTGERFVPSFTRGRGISTAAILCFPLAFSSWEH